MASNSRAYRSSRWPNGTARPAMYLPRSPERRLPRLRIGARGPPGGGSSMRSRANSTRRAQPLRAPSVRVSTSSRRRTVARAGCRGQGREVVFSPASASPRRNAPGTRGGDSLLQCRIRCRVERLRRHRRADGQGGADRAAGQSGRRPQDPPLHFTGLRSNKFSVAFDEAMTLYRRAATLPGLEVSGIACHIGSQLLDPRRFAEAADKILGLVDRLAAEGIARLIISIWGVASASATGRDATLAGGLPGATARALQRPQRRDLHSNPTLADRQCGAAADQNRVSPSPA